MCMGSVQWPITAISIPSVHFPSPFAALSICVDSLNSYTDIILYSKAVNLLAKCTAVIRVSCDVMVEKEKDALEGDKNKAIEFLSLENKMFKEKNHICQYYM